STLFAVCVLSNCASWQEKSAAKNCSLDKPPRDAGVNGVHGYYMFVFPRELPSNYSGCQIAWGEDGRKWYVLQLESGKPTQLTIDIPSPGANGLETCVYSDSGLTAGSPSSCFDLESARRGIPVMSPRFEHAIPPARDLRLK